MRIAGVDPSLAATGVATADGDTFTIKTKTADPGRLRVLYDGVLPVAQSHDLVIIEDLPTHAKSAGLTGRAQGVVRMAIYDGGAALVAVPPASLKMLVTNNGAAKKPDMRAAMLAMTGVDNPRDDEVDAWGLRQVGLLLVGDVDCVLPEPRAGALAKITIPEGVI